MRRDDEALDAINAYVQDVRQAHGTGGATPERTHYPSLRTLFNELGRHLDPRVISITDPAGRDGDFPDVALYHRDSLVLALPVEVKPRTVSADELLQLGQARRYAASFGGGWVLLTNLHQFILARLQDDELLEVERVTIVAADGLATGDPTLIDPPDKLLALLSLGTETRATLTDPQRVAALLARHAASMRDAITGAHGDADELLAPIAEMFRSGLEAELDEEFFVPTVVQTLVYGLFAAWLESDDDGADFDWQTAAYAVEIPLFADILHATLRPKLVRAANLLPYLGAVAGVLQRVDRSAFAAGIAGDAIEYFYEPFLAQFDPSLRDRLGVWYTPADVATYQVRRVHHHLVEDLGIPEGLADDSVVVLDPAVGTGTYLAAVYRHIYRHHVANEGDTPAGRRVAAQRVRTAATTRIVGFELLPAAFVIAHLNLGRVLGGLGGELSDDERLRVYLTNSLIGWSPHDAAAGEDAEGQALLAFPELLAELESAVSVKQEEPVLAVLGNPPYEGYSSAETDEERALVEPWIEPLWREWGVRKHRLNDLYVRFWRIAQRRIADITGRGVVSFITNSQWLGGRSYPAMRESLLDSFQHMTVDDLHGSVHDRSVPNDESVFTTATAPGIRVGTAIVTAVRTGPRTEGNPRVFVRDLRGRAPDKRTTLREWVPGDGDYEERHPTAESRWKLTSQVGDDYPAIDEYFDFMRSGVQPVRDEAVLAFDRDELESRMADYFDAELPWDDLVAKHAGFGVERARYDGPRTRERLLDGSRFKAAHVVRYLHRPLDARWMYWEVEHKLLNEARRELLPYWIGLDRQQRVLVVPQTRRRDGAARPIAATQVPSFESMDPNARVFPLWSPDEGTGLREGELGYDPDADLEAQPNIRKSWIDAARRAGVEGDDDAVATLIFEALLGVCASEDWLAGQTINDDDFPTVPLPSGPTELAAAADTGRRYLALVDPDQEVPGVTTGAIDSAYRELGAPDTVDEDPVLEHGSQGRTGGRREGDALLWNDTAGWRNVPEKAWTYTLGGFNPLSKMLSYRVGLRLSATDRRLVMQLVRRLAALADLKAEANVHFRDAVASPLDLDA